jgi:hypothetical protein
MVRGILCRDQTNAQCNSVCKYDIVIETQKVWLYRKVTSPPKLVLRQVDDVPVVSPEGTSWGGKKMSKNFKKIVN